MAVDFGIVGSLSKQERLNMGLVMAAFFERDYNKVAQLHIEFGWVPGYIRCDEFAAAIRTVSEPIFAKNIGDISFGHFILELLLVAKRFELRTQPQLLLLQKTFLNVESLGRALYPDLNLWDSVYPFLRDWLQAEMGVKATLKRSAALVPDVIRAVPDLLNLVHQASDRCAKPSMQSMFGDYMLKVAIGLMIIAALGAGLILYMLPYYLPDVAQWVLGIQLLLMLLNFWVVLWFARKKLYAAR